MDSTATIYFLLTSFIAVLPQLLVIIAGIVFCFFNMAKSPQAGKFALSGLGVMLLMILFGLAFSYVQVQLPLWYRDSYQTIGYINFAVGTARSIFWSVGLGLILYAVWVGRSKD